MEVMLPTPAVLLMSSVSPETAVQAVPSVVCSRIAVKVWVVPTRFVASQQSLTRKLTQSLSAEVSRSIGVVAVCLSKLAVSVDRPGSGERIVIKHVPTALVVHEPLEAEEMTPVTMLVMEPRPASDSPRVSPAALVQLPLAA